MTRIPGAGVLIREVNMEKWIEDTLYKLWRPLIQQDLERLVPEIDFSALSDEKLAELYNEVYRK